MAPESVTSEQRLNGDGTPHVCQFDADGRCQMHPFTHEAPSSKTDLEFVSTALHHALGGMRAVQERAPQGTAAAHYASELEQAIVIINRMQPVETSVCNWLRTNRRDGQPSAFVEANCGVSFRVQIGTVSEYRFCPSCGKRTVLQGSSEEPACSADKT